jgi:hypothetical protein
MTKEKKARSGSSGSPDIHAKGLSHVPAGEKGDLGLLVVLGKIGGIGGIALGVFVVLLRQVIVQDLFPKLPVQQGYNLLLLFILFTFSIAIAGLAVWAYSEKDGKVLPMILLLFALIMGGLGVWAIIHQKAEAESGPISGKSTPAELPPDKNGHQVGGNQKRDPTPPSLQVPLIDLVAKSVVYKGSTSVDYDSDELAFDKMYRLGITLKNVGQTAAVDTRVSYSCLAYRWGEKEPSPSKLRPPARPGPTLAPQETEEFDLHVDKRFTYGGKQLSPTTVRCFVSVTYRDVSGSPRSGEFCVEGWQLPTNEGESEDLKRCDLNIKKDKPML